MLGRCTFQRSWWGQSVLDRSASPNTVQGPTWARMCVGGGLPGLYFPAGRSELPKRQTVPRKLGEGRGATCRAERPTTAGGGESRRQPGEGEVGHTSPFRGSRLSLGKTRRKGARPLLSAPRQRTLVARVWRECAPAALALRIRRRRRRNAVRVIGGLAGEPPIGGRIESYTPRL